MRSLKILSSVSLIILCSVGNVSASGLGMSSYEHPASYTAKIGWDQNNIQAQTQGTVFLRAEIEKLKKQNEQLLNSLSQLKHNNKTSETPLNQNSEHQVKMQALIEENKRLSKLLRSSQSNAANGKSADVYAMEIYKLNKENDELKQKLSSLSTSGQPSSNSNLLNELETYRQENESLRQALVNKQTLSMNETSLAYRKLEERNASLQKENRGLALALAEATEKTLEYQQKANGLMSNERAKSNTPDPQLQAKIKTLTSQNKLLEDSLKEAQALNAKKSGNNSELLAIKKQNESLRQTIKAQSQSLISANNASQTAERLISENLMLKRKLEQSKKSTDLNTKTARQLFNENNNLKNKMANMERQITALGAERDNLVKEANERKLEVSQADDLSKDKMVSKSEMKDVSRSLQQALEKERATTIAYRTKIREYQDQIDELKNSTGNSDFESKIEDLTKENNALKIEVENLSKQASKNKSAIFAKMDKVDNSDLNYVNAPYPPVENVLPVLNENGEHIQYESTSKKIAAEDLLSQGPLGLSEK